MSNNAGRVRNPPQDGIQDAILPYYAKSGSEL